MKYGAFLLAAVLAAASAQAMTIDVLSDPADTTIGLNASGAAGVAWGGSTGATIGDDNATHGKDDVVYVTVFALPDLGGEAIDTANLSFRIKWPRYAVSGGVDVYGVRWGDSSSVLASDYAFGQPLVPAGNGTLIMDDIVVHNGQAQDDYITVETDAAADAALAAWLTSLYDDGAQPGDYAFLRINPDEEFNNYYTIPTGDSSNPPTLTISTIPEPTTMTMLVLALGGLAAKRRG